MGRNAKTKQIIVDKNEGKRPKDVDDNAFDGSDSDDDDDPNFIKAEKPVKKEGEAEEEKKEERVLSQDEIERKEAA